MKEENEKWERRGNCLRERSENIKVKRRRRPRKPVSKEREKQLAEGVEKKIQPAILGHRAKLMFLKKEDGNVNGPHY
jgi:hypothetical protein